MFRAIPLESVVEVVTIDNVARLPMAPPSLVGLFVLRRDVVPVVDLDPASRGSQAKIIVLVLRAEEGIFGVVIDREGTSLVQGRPEPGEQTVISKDHEYSILDPGSVWRQVRELVAGRYASTSPGGVVEGGSGESGDMNLVDAGGSRHFSPKELS